MFFSPPPFQSKKSERLTMCDVLHSVSLDHCGKCSRDFNIPNKIQYFLQFPSINWRSLKPEGKMKGFLGSTVQSVQMYVLQAHISVSGALHEAVLPEVKEFLTCTGCLIGEWCSPDCENSCRLESPCGCRCCNIDGLLSWRRPCRMRNAGHPGS